MNNTLLFYNETTQEIQFNFGGFYNSKHLAIIESNLESTLSNIESDKIKEFKNNELFDFETTKINYTKALLKLLDNEFKTNFLECFKKIWSPKEYNYFTDIIILDFKKFTDKDIDTIKSIETFLENIENYNDLEFETAFFDFDQEKLKTFINDNLNLDSEILETILENFDNLKNQNFINLDDFKETLREVYDCEITYFSMAIEYLKNNDISLKKSLQIAYDLGYDLKNLDSESLASLLKQDNFSNLINNSDDDLKIIFELFKNHI